MKSSVGVKICAVFLLIGSALGLIGAAGMIFVFAGPLSRQFFDPANLPPGADVRMMRGAMLDQRTGHAATVGVDQVSSGVGDRLADFCRGQSADSGGPVFRDDLWRGVWRGDRVLSATRPAIPRGR